jgi:hypothetical protein
MSSVVGVQASVGGIMPSGFSPRLGGGARTMRRRPRYTPIHDPLFPRAHYCELCDILLDPGHEPDVIDHEREHPRMLEMERWTGRLMSYAERREIEHESARILDNSNSPLDQRVIAAPRSFSGRITIGCFVRSRRRGTLGSSVARSTTSSVRRTWRASSRAMSRLPFETSTAL